MFVNNLWQFNRKKGRGRCAIKTTPQAHSPHTVNGISQIALFILLCHLLIRLSFPPISTGNCTINISWAVILTTCLSRSSANLSSYLVPINLFFISKKDLSFQQAGHDQWCLSTLEWNQWIKLKPKMEKKRRNSWKMVKKKKEEEKKANMEKMRRRKAIRTRWAGERKESEKKKKD